MKSLLFLLLLPYLIHGQSLLSCNFTTVNQTARGGTYQYYALTLHFSGAVSIPGYTTATSPDLRVRNLIWWQVRERMRFVSDRQPDLDLVVSKDFQSDTVANFYYNTDLILNNSLRLNVAKHLDNGEQITVSYWRPAVAPLVDLLVGGTAMGDFSCTATMPNVTRLVQQSTLTTISGGPLDTLALTFSRPVVRCGGLPVNVTDLQFANGDLLSAACLSLSSYSDQRVYYCRSFTAGYASYITDSYFLPLWPVNVCDRATNTSVTMDAFSWAYLNRGYSQRLGMGLATYELWALNTTSRTLAFAWPASSWVPPVPDSASYLRLGVPGDSQAQWYPISGWYPDWPANDTFLGLYPLSVPEMGVNISSYYSPGTLVCVNILSRVVQTLGSPSDLTVTFEFAFYDYVWPVQYSFAFALYSGTTNLLASATSNPSLGVYVFAGSTAYYSSSSVVGYLYTTGYSVGTDTTQVYSQKINIQTANPLPIRLVAATQVAFTLTLTFNNSLSLSQAILARVSYSCGTLSDLSITGNQTVQVTSSHQYCAGGTLTLSADAVWTAEQAFPTSQVFADIEATVLPLFNGTCRLEQISDDRYGNFYALVLDFLGPVTFSRAEGSSDPDINWPRVRARMRITSSRLPGYDLLTAKELLFDTSASSKSNPYVLSGSTLRVMVGLTLEEGETITVRYWQPPVNTLVDLLVLGRSAPAFECTATMPAVTRLISQVTVFNYLFPTTVSYLPAMAVETVMVTFSRPVKRCDNGGPLTVDNLLVQLVLGGYDALSVLCSGLESVYDQRTWRCTGFVPDSNYMSTLDVTGHEFVNYIQPFEVCDRETNATVVSDMRNCWDASTTSTLGIVQTNMDWFGQNWVFDPVARTLAFQYESCGNYPPLNGSSPTPIVFQGGLSSVSSTYSWFPISVLPTGSTITGPFAYNITYSPLTFNYTLLPSNPATPTQLPIRYNAYRPQILLRISQSLNQTTGVLSVTFSYLYSSATVQNRPVLIASGINGTLDLLSGVTGLSSLSHTWPLAGFTFFRTDLWGYIESTRTTGGNAFMQTYSQPLNATVDLLRLASATLSADGTSLRLVFNQTASSTLLFFNPALISLSCGTPLTLLAVNSTSVDLGTQGLCPGAALVLESNLTWSTQDWFYLPQTFSSFNFTPMVFTEARLLNGSLLELYVPLEANASELFFDPAQLRLTCNGSSSANATVYPNGTVTGCWPPLGVRLEILGAGALTDGVRELSETLVGTEWAVFVSSEANRDCPVYPPCPGPPGPKNRNNFFRLSIGWILGATLIPGFIGWVLGFILGLKLVPPIKYHLVPHDVFQVGYTDRIEME
jgi:hypothetical protein